MITIFKKKRKPQTDEMSVLFTWSLISFVGKDFSKLLEGKSDEFQSGFKFCVEQYRNEICKMGD